MKHCSLVARFVFVIALIAAFVPVASAQGPNGTGRGSMPPLGGGVPLGTAAPAPNDHSVLILGSSVSGGTSCLEAQHATALGLTPVVVDDATWSAMTAADFASYRALVFGDPDCQVGTSSITAAENNRAVWGPVVGGNIIIMGTDPVFHASRGTAGASVLIEKGIGFAAAEPGKTGAYICLSCYYFSAPSGTPVPLLDPFGPFTVVAQAIGACPNAVHIIATSPALAGLGDADLSNWGCSTHEGFDSWPLAPPPPSGFAPLAICTDLPSSFLAPDGTRGAPYIIQRGAQALSGICLTPANTTLTVGAHYNVCAFVNDQLDCHGNPLVGVTVTFLVTSGPDAGLTGSVVTNASGQACFGFTGTMLGTDGVRGQFTDAHGAVQYNTATVTFTSPVATKTATWSKLKAMYR
jgi:hypothetical protein